MGLPVKPLLPLFARLVGRRVVVVGGGAMAASRARQLAEVGALVTVVAPDVRREIEPLAAEIHRRPFRPSDLDGAWYGVAAATTAVNREVASAAEERRMLLNAVDEPALASAYAAATIRRGPVTVSISSGGLAPALTGLVREGLEALLPPELEAWACRAAFERLAWRREGVPMVDRRPLLLRTLNDLYRVARGAPQEAHPARGFVSLVGAGPGDAGLLTLRGAERLRRADVVFYDALVRAEVLDLAPGAQRCFVGKRAGKPGVSQRTIGRLLIRSARRGKRVVRLKGGDPFVLGRGGEEATALMDAGIPFEVVPGLSSALACPALAGIPLTHRGLGTAFVVLPGHAEASYGPILGGLQPGSISIVILMGLGERRAIAARLRERGWPEGTPAAIVLGASGPEAATWRGTLGGLGSWPVPPALAHLPGTIVIGPTASLSLLPADAGAPDSLQPSVGACSAEPDRTRQ